MNKIYYYKQEVKLGDIIDINNIKVTVTKELIDNNPDKFIVKDNNEFKPGDWVVWSGHNPVVATIHKKADYFHNCYILNIFGDIKSHNSCHKSYLRLATDDEIKEAAEKYIKDNSVKILEDYEGILLNTTGLFNSPIEKGITLDRCNFYYYLKSYEPKLYWTKVLQLIADDLNKGWKPNWTSSQEYKYYIYISHNCSNCEYCIAHYSTTWGQTAAFKSQELAQKAIDIMEDKLDYILKY